METLKEFWNDYREKVIPPEAGDVQLEECQKAFYAGAVSFKDILSQVYNMSDEKREEALMNIDAELAYFIRRYDPTNPSLN